MDVYIKEGRVYGLLKNRKILKLTLDNQRKIYRKKIFVTKQRDSCTMETYCYMKMIRKTVMKTTDQMR